MKHTSEKPLASYNYARCFNSQCAKADNCLHRLAALHDTTEYPTVWSINPLCIPADSNQCPYFQSSKKVRMAWGINHLLDEVPHKNLQPLKSQLIAHFGRNKYYRFYREECYLTPEDQDYIRKAFRQHNIPTEPAFNSYSEEYQW